MVNTDQPDYTPAQNTLDNLQSWATNNHVTINSKKTVVIHFDFSKSPTPPPTLNLANQTLQVVHSVKLLGITIDDKLTWNLHVNTIGKAASYRLYMLRRLRSLGMTCEELVYIYKTFILPKFTYASPCWSNSLTDTQLLKLERVQKRAMKIIYNTNYTTYDQALLDANLLPLKDQYLLSLTNFGKSHLKDPRHRHFIPPDAPINRYNTRHNNTIVPTRPRTLHYQTSTIPSIISILNK